MPYVGNTPALNYTSFAVQHFTTSATTGYTLDHAVTNENDIRLVINNVVQQPGGSYAYTAAGTTLTLSAATTGTDTMYCVFLGKAVQTVTPPDGSVSESKLQVSNSPTNGQVLSAQSGAAGGLTWAADATGTVTGYTNGVDDRVITSSGATTLNGEARLRYDGDVLWQEANGTTTEFRQTVDGAGTYWSSLIASASDVKLYTRTASPLILGTNNAEKMRVANDGNVGISETNPTARLQVDAGDDNITALKIINKGGYTGIHLQGDSSNTGTTQILIDASGTGDQYLKFQSATVTKWQIKDDYSDGHRIWIADDSGDGVYMDQNDTSWSSSSDERLKDNWTNFENAENKINTLTKLGTHKRKIYNKENNTIGETVDGVFNEIKKDINGNDIISVGISAQEIEAILPEAVTEDANGYKGVNYQSLIPMLLKAVQELSAKVTALENA